MKSSRMKLSFVKICSTRRKSKSFRTAPPKKKLSKDLLQADKQDEKVEAIQVKKKKLKMVLIFQS